jgi:hypothetical protein
MSIQKIKKSKSPLLWLQSDLWYSPIAVFKIALKIKKDPCGFIRKSLLEELHLNYTTFSL